MNNTASTPREVDPSIGRHLFGPTSQFDRHRPLKRKGMHGRPPKHPLPRSLNGLVLGQANVRRTKAGVSVEELVETWAHTGHAGRGVRLGTLSAPSRSKTAAGVACVWCPIRPVYRTRGFATPRTTEAVNVRSL